MITTKEYTKEELLEFITIVFGNLQSNGLFTLEKFDTDISHNWADALDGSKDLINTKIEIKINLLNKCKK